jgi:hypothetical protein
LGELLPNYETTLQQGLQSKPDDIMLSQSYKWIRLQILDHMDAQSMEDRSLPGMHKTEPKQECGLRNGVKTCLEICGTGVNQILEPGPTKKALAPTRRCSLGGTTYMILPENDKNTEEGGQKLMTWPYLSAMMQYAHKHWNIQGRMKGPFRRFSYPVVNIIMGDPPHEASWSTVPFPKANMISGMSL